MKENYFQQGILPINEWIFDLTSSQTGSASLMQSALSLVHQPLHKMMCMPTIHHFTAFLRVKTFFCLSFKYRRASLRESLLPCTETREFLKS